MTETTLKKTMFACALSCASLAATAQVTMNIDATKRGPMVSDYQYGLFFEEINHAGDGGLYAELIRNRSFEDNTANPDYWNAIGGATLTLSATNTLNSAQAHALALKTTGASSANLKGAYNEGYWGMAFTTDSTYTFSAYVKAPAAFKDKVFVQLQNADGTAASAPTALTGNFTANKWVKLTATVKATASTSTGRLALLTSANGTMYVDVASLMPYTWKGRANGMRPDLAQLLHDTKPTFLRFPGGCYVEGMYALENSFQWKNTLGPIENRPGHYSHNWGYRSTDGLGYDEYLQLCEDLGAAPMFVVNVGLGHEFTVPFEDVDTLVQNTLDAIEYANGDETTTWGKRRIANGHKEPYNLKFIEVGNENGQPEARTEYSRRYAKFYEAIRAKYPDIVIIGNVEAWGTDDPLWVLDTPTDLVDEHYYRTSAWMRANYNKYDYYPRTIGVYNGEYAANSGDWGKYGNLNAALGEAIYMLGMEKNSDVCKLASFAPIFTHEQDPRWAYDMIHFNAGGNFCTPSYYVQKLLGNNLGKQNLKWTETGNATSVSLTGKVGVGAWNTQVAYDDVTLTDGEGNTLLSDDFSSASSEWTASNGTWTVSGGQLEQTASAENCVYINNKVADGSKYTLKLRAKKTGGGEGFLIIFNYQDENNYCWWNLGGWNNTAHGVEQCVNGSKSTLASASGSIATGEWYDVEIDVDGCDVTCKLGGQTIHQFSVGSDKLLYQAAQIDEEQGLLYLKVVNPNSNAATINLNLQNMTATGGTVVRLTSANGTDENTMDEPFKIVPSAEETLTDVKTLSIPANSLNVYKLNITDAQAEVSDGILEEDADKYGYLYAHMHRSNEYTCYALSQYGTVWNDMFSGGEVFDTKKYTATGGMRDAYVTRMQNGKFMLAGTDMTSALGWTSNHIMVLMLSNDLVHWDKSVSIDLESDENLKALGGITKAQMTAAWAPEVIYDPVTKKYVVYYSVGFPDRHRIYYSLVNEDLTEISEPKLYFDPGYDIIDADIVYNKLDDQYVMIFKSEYASGTGAHSLYRATAKTLVPSGDKTTGVCQWEIDPDFRVSESGQSIEAPSLFRPLGSKTWKLAYQKYSGGYAYRLLDLDEHCQQTGASYTTMQGDVAPQHGSFLALTEKEYTHLQTWEKVVGLLAEAKALNASMPLEILTAAIAKGEKAIGESGSFDEEYAAMQDAYNDLHKAYNEYNEELRNKAYAGELANITFLLTNPDFSDGSTGWSGTSFTAANGYVAEQYNKTFDFYQTLTGLPNGKYKVEVQSFYRAGSIATAYNAHTAGTEKINAMFYANDVETPVKSLFDSERYTYSPYTFPDNVATANTAFNNDDQYHNELEVTVTDGTLKIGIKSATRINADWCCFDNFKLTYLDAGTNAIRSVKAELAAGQIYSLQGTRLAEAPEKGIYIQDGQKRAK